jgi:hypothetical protein
MLQVRRIYARIASGKNTKSSPAIQAKVQPT